MAMTPLPATAHVGSPNKHWEEHSNGGRYDYYMPYCFEDGWPNGSYGTSANNVANGVGRWNDRFFAGLEIDFRYGRMADCDDRGDEDLVARMRDLPSGTVGQLGWAPLIDVSLTGHLTSASLLIDNNTGNAHPIYYGGCCPSWGGPSDSRYHVASISAHEAGHAAIMFDDVDDSVSCCDSDLVPTDVNWHSAYAADVMYTYTQSGEITYPTNREVQWLHLSYPYID